MNVDDFAEAFAQTALGHAECTVTAGDMVWVTLVAASFELVKPYASSLGIEDLDAEDAGGWWEGSRPWRTVTTSGGTALQIRAAAPNCGCPLEFDHIDAFGRPVVFGVCPRCAAPRVMVTSEQRKLQELREGFELYARGRPAESCLTAMQRAGWVLGDDAKATRPEQAKRLGVEDIPLDEDMQGYAVRPVLERDVGPGQVERALESMEAELGRGELREVERALRGPYPNLRLDFEPRDSGGPIAQAARKLVREHAAMRTLIERVSATDDGYKLRVFFAGLQLTLRRSDGGLMLDPVEYQRVRDLVELGLEAETRASRMRGALLGKSERLDVALVTLANIVRLLEGKPVTGEPFEGDPADVLVIVSQALERGELAAHVEEGSK